MAKQTPKTPDQPVPSQQLEARVDAMMTTDKTASEPLNIFAATEQPSGPPPLPASELPEAVIEATATAPVESAASAEVPEPALAIAPLDIDTPQSDAAIDDIVAQEADEVLAAEDAGILLAYDEAEEAVASSSRRGHPIFWFCIVLLVVVAGITAFGLLNPGLSFAP